MIRVVQYLNQFFGGIGGEDKAHLPPRVAEGAVGPARAVQAALGKKGEVVATLICGDNYFAEDIEVVSEKITKMIEPYKPDVLIAGPAFHAGRYGMACGAVCKAVQDHLGVPAVTGMYQENPGLEIYRNDVYIVPTADSARGMGEAIPKMVALARKLAAKEKIGRPSEEGYFPRGLLINEMADKTGAERVVDMLLSKLRGKPFESEVPRPVYDRVPPAPPIREMGAATIALVTDGSLAKLGMKFQGHLRKGMPILEDVLAGIAVWIAPDDGKSPVIRLDSIGKHEIGSGSAQQAILEKLVVEPLERLGLKLTQVDKYATELHNPEVTEPQGSGNVPRTNYRTIGSFAVLRNEIRKDELDDFVRIHGMPGFSPTQGHIASAIPYLGHAIRNIRSGKLKNTLLLAKGSLFLGRLTQLSDGISLLLEKNPRG